MSDKYSPLMIQNIPFSSAEKVEITVDEETDFKNNELCGTLYKSTNRYSRPSIIEESISCFLRFYNIKRNEVILENDSQLVHLLYLEVADYFSSNPILGNIFRVAIVDTELPDNYLDGFRSYKRTLFEAKQELQKIIPQYRIAEFHKFGLIREHSVCYLFDTFKGKNI